MFVNCVAHHLILQLISQVPVNLAGLKSQLPAVIGYKVRHLLAKSINLLSSTRKQGHVINKLPIHSLFGELKSVNSSLN